MLCYRYSRALASVSLVVSKPMRIGIVSDIHGNIKALDTALDRMDKVDEIWCPGDAINQYEFSNRVIARLQEIGARYILGNHEEVFLSDAGARAREDESIDAVLLSWMMSRPHFVDKTVNGLRILMFHSTPWEPYGEYLYPHSRFKSSGRFRRRRCNLWAYAYPTGEKNQRYSDRQPRFCGANQRYQFPTTTFLCSTRYGKSHSGI